MKAYDGNKHYSIQPGDYLVARKNHLIRYTKFKEDDQFIFLQADEEMSFKILPRRWMVERTFAWILNALRLSKDYEKQMQQSTYGLFGYITTHNKPSNLGFQTFSK